MPGSHNVPMAANPHPDHITSEMWWFIEQLELLEPADTVFSGSWGRFKPGYHCDYWQLWNHQVNGVYVWRNDYSIRLPDDKVGGTPLEQFGAAVDWTFASAQSGDPTNIRKYGARIRAAWMARDPRLKGWREILTQGDQDPQADGYDFVAWTERTPDLTHTWHFHFSCLRRYVSTLSVYQGMLSILRGEVSNMIRIVQQKGTNNFWTSDGVWRTKFAASDLETVKFVVKNNFGSPDTVLVVDRPDLFGRETSGAGSGGGAGDAASADEVRFIVHEELGKLKLVSQQG